MSSILGKNPVIVFWKVLANLKSLSFISLCRVKVYDSHIHPLLQQMNGLEELTLRLSVTNRSTFIESTHVNRQFLPQLRTLTLDIVTHVSLLKEGLELPSNEIQHLFYNDKPHELICYIQRQRRRSARSHILSFPFVLDTMEFMTSHFPEGLFPNVRRVVLYDSHFPLEHDFFVRMDASFPLLTSLWVLCDRPQVNKRVQQSNGLSQSLRLSDSIISTNWDFLTGSWITWNNFLWKRTLISQV